MTDPEIIALLHQRNEQGLQALRSRYGRLCLSLAERMLGSREDAEECLNDALLAVWNAIPPAKPRNFCAYLLRLVRNAAINRLSSRTADKRGGGQTPAALSELAECIPARDNVEQEADRNALLRGITAFLEGLPAQQRRLFMRRYWFTAAVSELAAEFEMSEDAVYQTLSRTRKRLAEYLRKEGLL